MGLYDAFRDKPLHTYYGPNKTAVTVDVLEAGLILAFVLLAVSFLLVLPGFRHKEFCMALIVIFFFVTLPDPRVLYQLSAFESRRTVRSSFGPITTAIYGSVRAQALRRKRHKLKVNMAAARRRLRMVEGDMSNDI